MVTRVQKWGNSLALRLPKAIAEEIGLKRDSKVKISIQHQQIVLEPLFETWETLDELLSGVTAENLHSEVETGPTAGGEVW